jgi:hypothetical protein
MSCTSAQRLTAGKLPAGAEALLDLPLPPFDFGTFGIANISPISGLAPGSAALRFMCSKHSPDAPAVLDLAARCPPPRHARAWPEHLSRHERLK